MLPGSGCVSGCLVVGVSLDALSNSSPLSGKGLLGSGQQMTTANNFALLLL